MEEKKLDLIEKFAEPCLICGTSTTILHFQLIVCRACSSFYRRSLDKYHLFKCQKTNGKCDTTIKPIGKARCQYCRFQKCIKVGMKLGNEKCEKEIPSTPKENKREILPSNFSEEDFANLFEKTLKIFEEPSFYKTAKISSSNNEFTKLLESYIESRKPNKVLVHFLKADPDSYSRAQSEEFIKIAQLLNLYEPFSTLNSNDKNLLFKKFWEIFSGLEKFYQSCLYFGNNPKDVRIALWSYYIDYDEIIRDANDVITGETDKTFLIPMLYKARKIFKLFKKLNITLFELAYMSQIALWCCYDILGISKGTQKFAGEMLEKASNEMHEFFVNELRIPYYATRQSQLFKIVQNIEINVNARRQMFLAKDIFDFGSNANEENHFFNQYYKYIKKQ